MWRIEFFEILAQIGPVLLLAYVLEARGAHRDQATELETTARTYGLLIAAAGEVLALVVVSGVVDPTRALGAFAAGSMLFSFAYIPLAVGDVVEKKWPPQAILSLVLAVAALLLLLTAMIWTAVSLT
jgi:hypothetical protein